MTDQNQLARWNTYWKLGAERATFDLTTKFRQLGFTVYEQEPDDTVNFGGMQSNVRVFVNDGKMYVLKHELEADFEFKKATYPVPFDVTYEEYTKDIKQASNKNAYFPKYLGETDHVLVFSLVDGYKPLDVSLFRPLNPDFAFQFKLCSSSMDPVDPHQLRTACLRYAFYNNTTNSLKIVDFSSVWYVPVGDNDAALIGVVFGKNDVAVFTTAKQLNKQQESVFAMIRRDAYNQGYGSNVTLVTV